MFSIVCLMLLSHSILGTSTPVDDKVSNPNSIFILAGQSNMAGRGNVVGNTVITPPGCEPNPQILRLNANGAWVEAREPLHKDIDLGKACGVGPGMAFANSVLKRYPAIGVIGLVPCAIGGTTISQWLPGQKLYNNMLSRTRAALSTGGSRIEALLWYQGESDTVAKENADSYKENLIKVLTQLRSDLQLPTLPVIEVALAAHDAQGIYFENIRKDQLETSKLLPNVKCVDALGFEVNNIDHIHLTGEAQAKLGKMMAAAFLNETTPQLQNDLNILLNLNYVFNIPKV